MKILVALVFLFSIGCSKRPADIVNHNTTQVVNEYADSIWYYYGHIDTLSISYPEMNRNIQIPLQEENKLPIGYIDFDANSRNPDMGILWQGMTFHVFTRECLKIIPGGLDSSVILSSFRFENAPCPPNTNYRIPFLVVR